MTDPHDFMECAACAAKPGSPALCAACLHNRRLAARLQELEQTDGLAELTRWRNIAICVAKNLRVPHSDDDLWSLPDRALETRTQRDQLHRFAVDLLGYLGHHEERCGACETLFGHHRAGCPLHKLPPALSETDLRDSGARVDLTYVVELEPGVWVGAWDGDPGRTALLVKAQRFSTREAALEALAAARMFRPFRDGRLVRLCPECDGTGDELGHGERHRCLREGVLLPIS